MEPTLRSNFVNRTLPALLILAPNLLAAAIPRDAMPLEAAVWPENYRLHFELSPPGESAVRLSKSLSIALASGSYHDLALEHPASGPPVLRVWSDGKLVRGPEEVPTLRQNEAGDFPDARVDLGSDFTAMVAFEATGDGTLFSKCAPEADWAPNAKALFIREGKLVYDIGWLGAIGGDGKVSDGQRHTAVLSASQGSAKLWLDGKVIAESKKFQTPDVAGHLFKVGRASPDFAGELKNGNISTVKLWSRALPKGEISTLFKKDGAGANTPDFTYTNESGSEKPAIEPAKGVNLQTAWEIINDCINTITYVNFLSIINDW